VDREDDRAPPLFPHEAHEGGMEAPTPTRPSDGVPRRAGKRVRTMGNKIKIPLSLPSPPLD